MASRPLIGSIGKTALIGRMHRGQLDRWGKRAGGFYVRAGMSGGVCFENLVSREDLFRMIYTPKIVYTIHL